MRIPIIRFLSFLRVLHSIKKSSNFSAFIYIHFSMFFYGFARGLLHLFYIWLFFWELWIISWTFLNYLHRSWNIILYSFAYSMQIGIFCLIYYLFSVWSTAIFCNEMYGGEYHRDSRFCNFLWADWSFRIKIIRVYYNFSQSI